jgi:hypothetical protein
VSPKPKGYFPLEDHQNETPDDSEVGEKITLTYRDDATQVVEEIEFDVTVENGVRFHWWMVSQGISSA